MSLSLNPANSDLSALDGALVINKDPGLSSFKIVEELTHRLRQSIGAKKRKEVPKIGHGGTLDPFATGLLPVCMGRGVKLSRYFLEASKEYQGTIRFGETTVPGDPTDPISERSDKMPESLAEIQGIAQIFTHQPYLQIPPMHSAKKVGGKPLYELARQGIEIEREPKLCHLYEFEITSYQAPHAEFRVVCSSGTYIRVLAQDMARMLGTVGMLDRLVRTRVAGLRLENAVSLKDLAFPWNESAAFVGFDHLLDGYASSTADDREAEALIHGQQGVLLNIVQRAQTQKPGFQDSALAIYHRGKLRAVARKDGMSWGIERVFT